MTGYKSTRCILEGPASARHLPSSRTSAASASIFLRLSSMCRISSVTYIFNQDTMYAYARGMRRFGGLHLDILTS